MSSTTKRKFVTQEVLNEYTLPQEHQQIVKVTASRGSNLHEVQTATGDLFLVSMPTRFRKYVWIKRGDFIIIDPIKEGAKVKAEIATILYPKQVKYIQKEGLWPAQFSSTAPKTTVDQNTEDVLSSKMATVSLAGTNHVQDGSSDEESDDNDDDLFVNTNRPPMTYYYSDSDESEAEDDGNEDER